MNTPQYLQYYIYIIFNTILLSVPIVSKVSQYMRRNEMNQAEYMKKKKRKQTRDIYWCSFEDLCALFIFMATLFDFKVFEYKNILLKLFQV